MSNILPLRTMAGASHLGAMAFVLDRLDAALFDGGGRDEDPLERMAREDVAADALHDLLIEYLDGYEAAGVSEAEYTRSLARLLGHGNDDVAEYAQVVS